MHVPLFVTSDESVSTKHGKVDLFLFFFFLAGEVSQGNWMLRIFP